MEHDSPTLLFRLACEQLRSSRVIRPGPDVLSRRVGAARERAKVETYVRVEPVLTRNPRLPSELDGLLEVDLELGSTRLAWLGRGPTRSSPSAIKSELEKHAFLSGVDAFRLDLTMLPPERRRFLATIGRRSTAQALARRDPDRRYPILLALLQETAVDVLDEVVQLYDQAVSSVEGRAERKLEERLVARAKASEGRLALMDEMLAVVCDPAVPDDEVGAILRSRIGIDRLRAAKEASVRRLPRDHGHLEMIEASYNHVREFAPAVLNAIRFDGGTQARPLLRALELLRELNATAGRRVPSDAPTDFVPTRWRGYLQRTAAEGDAKAYRHYWELTVLLGLRDALRSGDVFVPGSRRYADPASYLMTPAQWETQRLEFCHLVGKPADPAEALAVAEAELHVALADLEEVLASGAGPVRLNERGDLVIPPLSAETIPEEAAELLAELVDLMPRPQIASLLIEVNQRTGFLDHLAHAGGKVARSPELARNLYAVIIAQASNMGLTAMAEASGIPYDVLAWTAEWYLREETLRAAIAAIVNYHHSLPQSQVWGGGTLSSSDGQRFPTRGKSITARALSRYFVDEGISTYTHVSDQHSTYGTKVIVVTDREAHYVLDEILGNQTDLPIVEHATDTHGRDPGQLRTLRSGRQAALAADPGPGAGDPLPDRDQA